MIDNDYLKLRIQHFLLQQDRNYIQSVRNNMEAPSVQLSARTLAQVCPIGVRRLERYLSRKTTNKTLQIRLDDIAAFSKLAQQNVSTFIAYLLEEPLEKDLSPWQRQAIRFFEGLDLDLRRKLTLRAFGEEQLDRNQELLEILLQIDKLSQNQLETVKAMIDAFKNCDSQLRSKSSD